MRETDQAAEQAYRLALQGAEVLVKISGFGLQKAGEILREAMHGSSPGAQRLQTLMKEQKGMELFPVSVDDLPPVLLQLQKSAIPYTMVKDEGDTVQEVGFFIAEEDAGRFQRLLDRVAREPHTREDSPSFWREYEKDHPSGKEAEPVPKEERSLFQEISTLNQPEDERYFIKTVLKRRDQSSLLPSEDGAPSLHQSVKKIRPQEQTLDGRDSL